MATSIPKIASVSVAVALMSFVASVPADAAVVMVRPPNDYPLPCDIYGVRSVDADADDAAHQAYVDACGDASDVARRRPQRDAFRRQNEDATHDTKPCDFADCVVVKDRIFGDSTVLSPKLAGFVRSPEFQRLRRVEQNLNLAYAHGSHLASTEFQHALGTFRIGDQMLRQRAAYADPVLCGPDGDDDDELLAHSTDCIDGLSSSPSPDAAGDGEARGRQGATAAPVVLFDYHLRCRHLNATLVESIQLALLAHSLGALPFPHLTDTDRDGVRPLASLSRAPSSWLADYLDDAYQGGGYDARGMASGRRRSAALLRRMAPRLVGFTAPQIELACDIIVGARDRHHGVPAFAFQLLASRSGRLGVDRVDQMLRDAAVGVSARNWPTTALYRQLYDPARIGAESREFVCDDALDAGASCDESARRVGEFYHVVRLYIAQHPTVKRADELTIATLRQVAVTRDWAHPLSRLDGVSRVRVDDWSSTFGERAHDLLRSVFASPVVDDEEVAAPTATDPCPPQPLDVVAVDRCDDQTDECCGSDRCSQTEPGDASRDLTPESVDAYRRLVLGRFWEEAEQHVDDSFDRAAYFSAAPHTFMGLYS